VSKKIRRSKAFFENTRSNGLSTFYYDDFISMSDRYGPIVSMKQVGFTLKVLQHHKETSIYIGVNGLKQAKIDGQDVVVSSDNVFNNVNQSEEPYGCMNPESVLVVGRNLYWYDSSNGCFVRSSPNGTEDISAKYKISSLVKQFIAGGDMRVISGYDKRYEEVIFSLQKMDDVEIPVYTSITITKKVPDIPIPWSGIETSPGLGVGGYQYSHSEFGSIEYAQSFLVSEITPLVSIVIPVGGSFGSPDFNIGISICESTGGEPGTELYHSGNVMSAVEFSTPHYPVITKEFTFTGATLSPGEYFFLITYEDVVTHNFYNFISIPDVTTNTYPDGRMHWKPEGSSWAEMNIALDIPALINFVLAVDEILLYPDQFFKITATGDIPGNVHTGWVHPEQPLVFNDIPYDNYVISEEETEGYSMVSITPSSVYINTGDPEQSVEVVNNSRPYSIEINIISSRIFLCDYIRLPGHCLCCRSIFICHSVWTFYSLFCCDPACTARIYIVYSSPISMIISLAIIHNKSLGVVFG